MKLRLPLLASISILVLSAQDASLVLRTSVGYGTQRATLNLTEDQRRQADDFASQARAATQQQKYGEALRLYARGIAVMRNAPWTPAIECATALEAKVDHALVEPGKQVAITLKALFPCPQVDPKLTASVFLGDESVTSTLTIDPSALPFTTRITVPERPAGDYALQVRLSGGSGAPAGAFVKPLPVHIEALSADAERLRKRLASIKKESSASATAAYGLALYDLADRGELNPHRYKFHDEFAASNAILDALDTGADPFASRRGDMRKAYRSAVDRTLQPYRLFVPSAYDGSKPTPLVVALHGMGGDENSIFDSYQNGALKREADRLGMMVACPKGRDSASMYRGTAEQDVLDVLAEVRRDYRVDPNRIYLMGHSMGAYGTWSVAMAHPDVFAALGPISGGGDTNGMVKIRTIPEYVVHGDDDRTVNVSQSRRMVEAGRAAGIPITYVEVPGGSHVSVAAPQFAPMMDFFAKCAKK